MTECAFLGAAADEPCWGVVRFVDALASETGDEIYLYCCEGHAESDFYERKYVARGVSEG